MHLFPFGHRRRSGPVPPSGHEVVRLRGDLDARSAGRTGRRLLRLIETGPDVLEVDLTELHHLSPVGCAAFFTAVRAARARGTRHTAHGTRLIITHPSDQAQTVMRQIGLTYALTLGAREAGDARPVQRTPCRIAAMSDGQQCTTRTCQYDVKNV